MKTLLLAASVAALLSTAGVSKAQEATITLKGGKIEFRSNKETKEYTFTEFPGFKAITYTKKELSKNGKDIDASELTLENQATGDKLTIIESIPFKLIWDSQITTWKADPKTMSTEQGAAANH